MRAGCGVGVAPVWREWGRLRAHVAPSTTPAAVRWKHHLPRRCPPHAEQPTPRVVRGREALQRRGAERVLQHVCRKGERGYRRDGVGHQARRFCSGDQAVDELRWRHDRWGGERPRGEPPSPPERLPVGAPKPRMAAAQQHAAAPPPCRTPHLLPVPARCDAQRRAASRRCAQPHTPDARGCTRAHAHRETTRFGLQPAPSV